VPVGARPVVSPVTAMTALALLTLVGLVAGVWPAKRAADVYPAEALRAD
jgi:putative ABC transport system permease protein